MNQEKEYFAFISYQRHDEKWADWLRNKLEHYRLPSNLRRENTSLPKEIRPVFRDVLELSGGLLAEEILEALQQSRFLIVICSPNSAKSLWVNKEVQTFIELGRARDIIPFIVDGMPFSGNPDTECFTPALCSLKGENELLGININEMGRDAAAVKVVARMFGLKFDTLWQRYEREQKRRRVTIIGASLLFAIASLGIGAYVARQNRTLQENLSSFLSEKAISVLDEGDSYLARLFALKALPPNLSYTPNAEFALRRASCSESTVLRGHYSRIETASFSPDGRRIVSASGDYSVRVWDVKTGTQIAEGVHEDQVYFASFSPDGRRVVSASKDSTIRIWDAETLTPIVAPIKIDDMATSAVFSPDGKFIVSTSFSSEPDIRIWDASTGDLHCPPLKGHTQTVTCAIFSPDGSRIASGSWDNTVIVWDAGTGEQIGKPLEGHTRSITSVAFSPDGSRIISASSDGTIRIWDVYTGEPIGNPLIGHEGKVNTAVYSHDGEYIVSSSEDMTIGIWFADTGELFTRRHLPMLWANTAEFSPDDRLIMLACYDGSIRIWDTREIYDTNSIRVMEAPTPDIALEHPEMVSSISFNPDGSLLASGSYDGLIRIWDIRKGTLLGTPMSGHTSRVHSVSFSRDGRYLVSASGDHTIRIWDTRTREQIGKPLIGHLSDVNTAVFSPDGKTIVSASSDRTVRIWDVDTGEQIGMPLRGHTDWICSAAFSPNGKLIVSAATDGTLRVWSVKDHRQIDTRSLIDDYFVYADFSPDGKRIAATAADYTVRLWDVNGSEISDSERTLVTHSYNVSSAVFSHNGKTIVSSGANVIVWDVRSGRPVYEPGISGDYAIISPDGRSIATISGLWVCIWPYPPIQELIDETNERFKDRPLTHEELESNYLE